MLIRYFRDICHNVKVWFGQSFANIGFLMQGNNDVLTVEELWSGKLIQDKKHKNVKKEFKNKIEIFLGEVEEEKEEENPEGANENEENKEKILS
uniref:Uncharacterized protein n=1 Tax=Meloidogyne hapla TaxID=6305 RepID=A0A1I8AXR5_MELHA